MYTYISSRTNAVVKLIAGLDKKKNREEAGLYLFEGRKLCEEAVGKCMVRYAVVREDKKDSPLMELCQAAGGEVIVLSESAFEKVSTDSASDGVIFVACLPENKEISRKGERIIMLDSVRDPGNVGTVVRTAAAFGYDRVVLCDCADVYSPKTVRATMGAAFKMNISVCESSAEAVKVLREQGRRVIAAALGESALTLGKSEIYESDCFIIGNEGHGVSEEVLELCTDVIKIPMTAKTESLNAAVAASVIMWEQFKK